MNAPALVAQRFGLAFVIGIALGVYYSFLRPLRPKHTTLSDFLFVLGAGYGWLYLGFAVCRGDLRLSYTAVLALGIIVWEITLGRALRGVFAYFWNLVGCFFGFLLYPCKIFFKKCLVFVKFLLATAKKRFTIRWNKRQRSLSETGGVRRGSHRQVSQPHPPCIPAQFDPSEVCGPGSNRIVYGLPDGTARCNHRKSKTGRRPAPAGGGTRKEK